MAEQSRSALEGLERPCQPGEWIAGTRRAPGIELFAAHFTGEAYEKHRHDTYAIAITVSGVQKFSYRGAVHASIPGQVVALYPDEVHDGRAGTSSGFSYRIVYVEPALLVDAVRSIRGRPSPLPFVAPVSTNAALSRAVDAAFRGNLQELALDNLVLAMGKGLMDAERDAASPRISRRVDGRAVERARQFLDAHRNRVVRSSELELITGLTRYDLCRQFRIMIGTSPYRYLMMRRLAFAREKIRGKQPLVEVACDGGFADQAHFTRTFKAAFGMTPARYRALLATR